MEANQIKSNKVGLLNKSEIEDYLSSGEMIITPLLDNSQIGEISVDLRVGTDFLTSQLGREPYMDATSNNEIGVPLKSFFSETRRLIGEPFLIHPSQIVLFSTLEYIKIPKDVMVELSTRSSYSRLGVTISTIIQPGYCGCISVEVNYNGNTPLKIICGSRMLQARFYRLQNSSDYLSTERKYLCQVRPIASKANEDEEIELLKRFSRNL